MKVKDGHSTASQGPDVLCHQHHQKRVGAAGAADDMLGTTVGSELLLELGDFRAIDELAMVENALDRGIQRSAEPAALRADVDEGNGFGTQMLVHDLALGAFLNGRHG
ncbi:hypothetical protein ABH970_000200 [Bradyrhizobium ottawaense]